MWRRDLLRRVPGLSRVAKALDKIDDFDESRRRNAELTAEVKQLKGLLYQVLFANEPSLVDDQAPESAAGEKDLPVPSGALRFLVAGTENLQAFLESGKLGVKTLVDVLAKNGRTLDQCKKVLDFGCGCGRVVRHLKGAAGDEVHGCDSNPLAIQWCTRYLDFARFKVNSLEPPLPYEDGTFDLIYAFSVFTHLTEPLQARWMDELRRVLTPEGLLIITVHGDRCAEWLPAADRAEYFKGNMVVREEDVAGSNYCNSFHPESYVRNVMARGFDVVDFIPEGAKGNPPQDVYLLKSQREKEERGQTT